MLRHGRCTVGMVTVPAPAPAQSVNRLANYRATAVHAVVQGVPVSLSHFSSALHRSSIVVAVAAIRTWWSFIWQGSAASSGGHILSWIIYCWLVWCERKTLFPTENL